MPVPVPVPAHSTFSTPTITSAFLPGSSTPYTAPSSSSLNGIMSTTTSPPNGIAPSSSLPYPALYLYPLNDSFVPKHIALNHGQHVKIGRQTNAKTAPGERNGYFDSKVLSRQHAEVWEEAGKVIFRLFVLPGRGVVVVVEAGQRTGASSSYIWATPPYHVRLHPY